MLVPGSVLSAAISAVTPTTPETVGVTTKVIAALWLLEMIGNVHVVTSPTLAHVPPTREALTNVKLELRVKVTTRFKVLLFGPKLVTFRV